LPPSFVTTGLDPVVHGEWPGPMSVLRGSMDRRIKSGDDESVRPRDAAAHPSFAYAKKSQAKKAFPRKLLPLKEGRRSADRRVQEPHRKGMRRASFLLSSLRKNRGPRLHRALDLMERARSPFGAPPRHPRFWPRLGSGRASWNHRMQTGGPSPAPVQRAPRGPAGAGRDDAQAARERSVSPRPREPLPLRPKEYPRERRPSRAGFWLGNRYGDGSQERRRLIRDSLVGRISAA
jgi:hypothetical protein